MNEFYSIGQENKDLENPLQIRNLGSQTESFVIAKRYSSFWDRSESFQRVSTFRKITDDDYDRSFARILLTIKPPYEISTFLNYHLDFYTNKNNEGKDKFVKHIKYVVFPYFINHFGSNRKNKPYVDLLKEWIDENDSKVKEDELIKKLQDENIRLEHKLKRWQVSTRWWVFIIAIVASIIAFATFIFNVYFKK